MSFIIALFHIHSFENIFCKFAASENWFLFTLPCMVVSRVGRGLQYQKSFSHVTEWVLTYDFTYDRHVTSVQLVSFRNPYGLTIK